MATMIQRHLMPVLMILHCHSCWTWAFFCRLLVMLSPSPVGTWMKQLTCWSVHHRGSRMLVKEGGEMLVCLPGRYKGVGDAGLFTRQVQGGGGCWSVYQAGTRGWGMLVCLPGRYKGVGDAGLFTRQVQGGGGCWSVYQAGTRGWGMLVCLPGRYKGVR